MTLVAVRPANDVFLVRLEGVDTREQAAALTNFELWLPRPRCRRWRPTSSTSRT
jgi:ribosomal 30S subunit maturation factor RimM